MLTKETIEVLLQSFKVMGLGMLGIMAVACVLILIMVLITNVFPGEKEEKS